MAGFWRSRCRSVVAISLLAFAFSGQSWARPLQIIHTNDLHSYFEPGEGVHPEEFYGGYAAVKARIEEIRATANAQGIDTLVLDAGDFSEGTEFFLVDEGRESWRIMDSMGYDAIAVGNHDWLIGTNQMERIVGSVQPRTPFLSANLHFPREYTQLEKHIRPYAEFQRSGISIGVLGLSTHEFIYRWRVDHGFVGSHSSAIDDHVPFLKSRNDLVIALSHLGYNTDRKIAEKSGGIDLIVGGHSHTTLFQPEFVTNPEGQSVPIVQAGEHGRYVGDLLVDVEPGQPLRVLHYRLTPVHPDDPKNLDLYDEVASARKRLEEKYGADWLYEIVTFSEIPMERPRYEPTQWGNIYADAIRETARADLTIDIGEFFGDSLPAGPVTRERLFQFYPRVLDAERGNGWTVWRIKTPGWLVKLVITEAFKLGRSLTLSNVTYDVVTSKGKTKLKNFRIGGKKLDPLKNYRVGVTEGIGTGATEICVLLKLFFQPKDTGIPVLNAVEEKLHQMGGVITGSPEGERGLAGATWMP